MSRTQTLLCQEYSKTFFTRSAISLSLAGCLSMALLSIAPVVAAENPASVVAPSAASGGAANILEKPATLAGLNFLIVALDDIDPSRIVPRITPPPSTGSVLPLIPTGGTALVPLSTFGTTTASSTGAAIVPSPPKKERVVTKEQGEDQPTARPPASIRPLAGATSSGAQFWMVQSTPDRILPGPEPRRTILPEPSASDFPATPGAAGNAPAVPGVPGVPSGIVPGTSPSDATGDEAFSSLAPPRISRAQGAAVPLRRALLKAGSADVLTTGLDGAPVLRALNSHRLSQRTSEHLQESMARLIVAGKTNPDDEDLKTVIQNAARFGQALGYRGVIVLALMPRPEALPTANQAAPPLQEATYGMVVVDALRETGEPLVFDEKGVDEPAMHQAAAFTGGAIVEKVAAVWTPVLAEEKRRLSLNYLNKARDLLSQTAVMQTNPQEATRLQNEALDLLNQAVSLDVNQVEAYVMLGDLRAAKDASVAASEYSRAAQLKPSDGKVWTKVAIAYTKGTTPDWPRALDAAKRALALGYESAELHLAYAVTQWGRAEIFRNYNAEPRADAAESDARAHLDRALLLAPQDEPGVLREIAAQLVAQSRYKEGVSVLEKLSKLYPGDKETQLLLAQALLYLPNQQEEAFNAWAKVWKSQSLAQVALDTAQYAILVEGFDRTLNSLGKEAARLAGGVQRGGVPREQALLQMTRLRDDLNIAQETIKIMVAPSLTQRQDHTSRVFAGDLMVQAFGNYIMFFETVDNTLFNRASDLHRQSIQTLNLVRLGR